MDFERKIMAEVLKEFNRQGMPTLKDLYIQDQSELFVKDYQTSIEVRKEGNQLLTKNVHDEKVHEQVWKLYCQSIAYAPNDSEELAFGYSNRSVLLLHLKKYKDSLLDIDRALKVTKSSALKVKLFCRRTECLIAVQEGQPCISLKKAKFWLSKVDDYDEIKKLNLMIIKAAKVVDDNIPADVEKEKKNDILCDNDAVQISYDKKYGRCLVATKHIHPGEFVYVEKFYAASINIEKLYAYCSHCLGTSWSQIPCDQCAYYMFCSETCKDEAWERYHSVECRTKLMKGTHMSDYTSQLTLRSFVMGMKEAGSLQKLREMVKEVDRCKNPLTKGFLNDEFSNDSFRSLYSLTSTKNDVKTGYAAKLVMNILIPLAKNTDIFDKKLLDKKMTKNEDVLFIASLLLKLVLIFFYNSCHVRVLHINRECKDSSDFCDCITNGCCLRGTNIAPFTSLINHNCDNNVDKFYTNDGRVVYYATKPIKVDSQIFSAYLGNYIMRPKEFRQRTLNLLYDFKCDCVACKLDWPYLLDLEKQADRYPDNTVSKGLFLKNQELIKAMNKKRRARNSRKTISAFAKDVEELLNSVKVPTPITEIFQTTLLCMIENRYCNLFKVPSTC